ncbi:MAG: MinD/ParA family protein [Actinomycetota bacterium]
MTQFVTVHGFRRGVGKTTVAVNLAGVLARAGLRVLLVETARRADDAGTLLGGTRPEGFADLVAGAAEAASLGHDVTGTLGSTASGRLVVVGGGRAAAPDSDAMGAATTVAFHSLAEAYTPDLVVLDTAAGLTEETLTLLAVTDDLLLLVRPDRRDHQGSAVTADVAVRMGVPRPALLLTQVPGTELDPTDRARIEEAFSIPVAAVLPFSRAVAEYRGDRPFAVAHAGDPWSIAITGLASDLIAAADTARRPRPDESTRD